MHDDDGYFDSTPRPTDVLGVVGLVLAFCVSPVGLLVSLIAALTPPRAVALVGVVVGTAGTVLWVFAGMWVWTFVVAGMAIVEFATDAEAIGDAAESRRAADGAYPADIGALGLDAASLIDPWGAPYGYRVTADGENAVVTSAGPDGAFGTPDDLRVHRYHVEEAVVVAVGMIAAGDVADVEVIEGYGAAILGIAGLERALELHLAETGAYPAALTDIPGIDDELATDPWGRPFRYSLNESGGRFTLVSDGRDGLPGTDDDLDSNDVDIESSGRRSGP